MNFTQTVLLWYCNNKRELPWRSVKDPYLIWVSEIIMQQTRVEQGREYFMRFKERFPTVISLASAEEEDILHLWQGLGYYTRARNMGIAARDIVKHFEGVFPSGYNEILSLKGIGKYTASAIASIAFNLPFAVTDGNVIRFFARYFGITEPVDRNTGLRPIEKLAEKYLDPENPGDYNQAIMEFGALQCKPGKPDCSQCPLSEGCFAFKYGLVDDLPVKSKRIKPRDRYFNYLVIINKESSQTPTILLKKRTDKDIWRNLYDFPMVETDAPVSIKKLTTLQPFKEMTAGGDIIRIQAGEIIMHQLTHQTIRATFFIIDIELHSNPQFVKVPFEHLHQYPIPKLIRNFIDGFLYPLK